MHSILVSVIGRYTFVKLVELFSMIDNKKTYHNNEDNDDYKSNELI
jgi:hypothetical protein